MRIGVCLLTDLPWAVAEPYWRELDELGAAHAWTYDHLCWGELPENPWYSTVVTLAAAAVVTTKVRLGAWVFSPNYRHPVPLARDLAGLQDVSGGRVICAVGSGGEPDATVLGQEFTRGQRTRRLGEFTDLLARALTEDHVDHDGEFFTARDARNRTGVPAPPVVVAANGPRGIALATAHDGWATTAAGVGDTVEDWWAEVARLSRIVDDSLAARAGEQPARPFDRYLNLDSCPRYSLSGKEFCRDQIGRAGDLGFTDVVVHRPRPDSPYAGDPAVLVDVLTG